MNVGGGSILIVVGTNFRAGATVTFEGAPATQLMVNNPATLTAEPAANAAGPGTVAVTNPNAQSRSQAAPRSPGAITGLPP